MTNIEIKPAVHVLPDAFYREGRRMQRVTITAGPWELSEDGDWIGNVQRDLDGWDADGAPYHSYKAFSRVGDYLKRCFTPHEAAMVLLDHYLAQRQTVTLTVVVEVDREMWDLAYGDQGGDAERAEDVRSYVLGNLLETSQSRPGGEQGIQDVDVEHS